ncbi:hypothetical protein FMUND_5549 [Fusarium mundagurra]|uniref:BZIP domain-containing protein n=1 Tax=Fusarium mundagurra TaxID=1567541 RepID=A0A8H5YS39_9HYPO|nr:hypothetical protein FMUND_5549 [Fusarium mundagurra]
MSDPQKIAIEPMAQQLLVQKPGDDWTGVTSTAQRRKLQNRLNKRSQYLRKRQQQEQHRLASSIVGQAGLPAESMPSIALALKGPPDAMLEVIRQTCEVYERPDKSEKVFAVACKTYMDYTMNSPRISQLPLLISLNVTIAVANNATLLGFDRAHMCTDEAISPFNINGPFSADYNPPSALEPTEVQKTVLHHPWLDIFPFPKFRDNVILAAAAELLDDGELCEDISEINWENVEKPSLIVWGDSSVPNSWEASPWFLRKWGWSKGIVVANSAPQRGAVVKLDAQQLDTVVWPNGKASDYESEDSGFDPQHDHIFASSEYSVLHRVSPQSPSYAEDLLLDVPCPLQG